MEYHVPVLLNESVNGLNIKANGVYLDLTYGGGGHSREILRRLGDGRLISFDQDSEAERNFIKDDRLIFFRSNYRFFKRFLKYQGVERVDGILADLGVSSHHFEEESRGFSFRFDCHLDMRMNVGAEKTAEIVLNDYPEIRLRKIISEYGELANAGRIVKAILDSRKRSRLRTTGELLDALKDCIPENQRNKYLAKLFQALRIEVNDELDALQVMLQDTIDALGLGGRLVVISYHSLEDRLVKNLMRTGSVKGEQEKDLYGNVYSPFKPVNRKVIIPDDDEILRNNRARSAKLRIAERI